jgi:hypothetical protein
MVIVHSISAISSVESGEDGWWIAVVGFIPISVDVSMHWMTCCLANDSAIGQIGHVPDEQDECHDEVREPGIDWAVAPADPDLTGIIPLFPNSSPFAMDANCVNFFFTHFETLLMSHKGAIQSVLAQSSHRLVLIAQ